MSCKDSNTSYLNIQTFMNCYYDLDCPGRRKNWQEYAKRVCFLDISTLKLTMLELHSSFISRDLPFLLM